MIILAVDTSCDETSAAIVDGVRVLSNVVSSQVRYHKKFGGVVPFLAQRLHKERIDSVVELAISRAGCTRRDIQALAVTYGPGLAPALQVGISHMQALAAELTVPLYGINHMVGHLASCLAQVGKRSVPVEVFPALGVLVSGGHSEFVVIPKIGQYHIVGETLDDALGEAYDKVAKMLGLGYPGGKLVSHLAKTGNKDRFTLPIPMRYSKDCNLSYSGLKNAVRLLIDSEQTSGSLSATTIADICATFEEVAQASLLIKLERALREHEVKSLLVAGGVAANTVLRGKVRRIAKAFGVSVLFPAAPRLCGDNAAMIGVAASLEIAAGKQPIEVDMLDRVPGLRIDEGSFV